LTSTFVAGASMLLSSIQVEMNSIINQKPTEANLFKPTTEAGSRCFWIENQ